MRSRLAVTLLALPLAVAGASPAIGQGVDSVAFHQGQWGTEFTIASGFAAAGVFRFAGPTHAIVLDLAADYNHTSSSGGIAVLRSDDASLYLRTGWRSYGRLGANVRRFVTVGLAASYGVQTDRQDSTRTTVNTYGAGAFANVGATWLITAHLGLGAQMGGSLEYSRYRRSGVGTNRFRSGLGRVELGGQLYF